MNSNALKDKTCVPCKGGTPPLTGERLSTFQKELGGNWKVVHDHHLEKTFSFSNFKTALAFTNQMGELAESQGHHPDIALSWGKVIVTIWTHKVNGLTESDFVLAAKIDALPSR